jgi:hypothetical protein
MNPYQKYAESKIIEMGGKNAVISELDKSIKELAEYPSENLNQIIFYCGVLRYLKSL